MQVALKNSWILSSHRMSHSDLADNALNEVAMFKEMLESRGISPARVWDIGANVGLYAPLPQCAH